MEEKKLSHKYINRHLWRTTNLKLIPCAILFIGGIILSTTYGNVKTGSINHKLVALTGVLIFVIFSITFLHTLGNAIHKSIVLNRLGVGRAASLRFIVLLFGYLVILLTSLDHIGIPVERILLGSAVLGIILGVAAQQALANFFASIVLIVSHPFAVGEDITLTSGALGGTYVGHVADIGLTHTHLKQENGTLVALPNSTLLVNAAVKIDKRPKRPSTS